MVSQAIHQDIFSLYAFTMCFSQLCRPLPCVPAQSTSAPVRSTSKTSVGSTLERDIEAPKPPENTESKWNVVRRLVDLNLTMI